MALSLAVEGICYMKADVDNVDAEETNLLLVLESPVKSGFSALNGFNHNRNRLN
jgi:hypothetical protein